MLASHVNRFIISALAGLIVWATVPWLTVNGWSLQVEPVLMRDSPDCRGVTQPPQGHLRAELWRGSAALKEGQIPEAMESLKRAVDHSPEDRLSLVFLGRAYEAAGRMKDAVREWTEAEAWQEMIRAGQRAISSQRWDDAMLFLDAAQAHFPEQVIENRARGLNGKGDRLAAIALLRQSLDAWPRSPRVQTWRMLLGDYLGRESRWEEAEPVYRDAIGASGGEDPWWAHIGLGRALYNCGNELEPALAEIERGIALRPENGEGYTQAGQLLQREGRYLEADGWYRQAVAHSLGDPWPWVMRGENALLMGDASLAIRTLLQATDRFPRFAHSYLFLAQAYSKSGDVGKAIAAIETAVTLAPRENAWYWVTAGGLYESVGRLDRAWRAYQEALDLDPANGAARAGANRLMGQR